MRASYSIAAVNNDVIAIEDDNRGMSITNDAEAVIADLKAKDLLRPKVIYRDTDGVWDYLTHDGARFTGYAPLRARHFTTAWKEANGFNT